VLLLVQLRPLDCGPHSGRDRRFLDEKCEISRVRHERRKVAIPRKSGESIRTVSHINANLSVRAGGADCV
jgi:hypothetical protein